MDMIQTGIPGPVEIVGKKGDETISKDLSKHKWIYKVGLQGFDNKVYSQASKWLTDSLPTNRMMTWYKVYLLHK